jgi:predicted  nucleic acid-binding Zn-ribbon protein
VSVKDGLVRLHDLDLLLEETRAPGPRGPGRLPEVGALLRARTQIHARLDRHWAGAYDRAHQRYGRALVTVRGRVCQGCYMTLPTSAAASAQTLSVCESCGRILLWR